MPQDGVKVETYGLAGADYVLGLVDARFKVVLGKDANSRHGWYAALVFNGEARDIERCSVGPDSGLEELMTEADFVSWRRAVRLWLTTRHPVKAAVNVQTGTTAAEEYRRSGRGRFRSGPPLRGLLG